MTKTHRKHRAHGTKKSARLYRATTALLATSLGMGALASQTAYAMGDMPIVAPVCNTTVNLANCQVYLTSDGYCESLVKTQCQEVVSSAHAAERATISTTRDVLPLSQPNGNTTVSAKYVKDTMADHQLNGVDAMYVGNNLSSDVSTAQNKADRLAAILDNECTRAAAAAGKPNQICSCGQYAYDTFYSARPFERKVSQKGLDYRALFNEARALANTNINSKDGLYQTAFVPQQVARTAFHALDPYALNARYPVGTAATAKHQWDATVRAKYDNTFKTYTLTTAKHNELSAALAAIPDERLNNLFDAQQAFAADLAYRNARWVAFQAEVKDLATSSAAYQTAAARVTPELAALDAKLDEGLAHGVDLGCVPDAINNVTACDWSPKLFYTGSQAYFSKLGEERFQQCVQMTGDYFGNMPVAARDNSLAFTNQLITAKNTPAALSSVTAPDGLPTLGQQFSDDGQYGNDDFNVKYNYNFAWGITDYDQKDASGNPLFCKSNLRGGGKFDVSGTAFGKTREVVNFNAWAFTKTDRENNADVDNLHEQLSMQILGKDLFQPIDAHQHANYSYVANPSKEFGKNKEYEVSKTFVVVAVPVTVTAGLSGVFGVDIKLQGGVIRDCQGAPDTMNIGVSSDVKPYAELDAYVSAGVGWSGLSAGVKGEVKLIAVELPFKAKAGLEFLRNNTGSDLFLVGKADLDLGLETLSGKVSVYVEYLIGSSEKEIFSWNGYKVNSKLFELDARFPLIQVANMPTTPAAAKL